MKNWLPILDSNSTQPGLAVSCAFARLGPRNALGSDYFLAFRRVEFKRDECCTNRIGLVRRPTQY